MTKRSMFKLVIAAMAILLFAALTVFEAGASNNVNRGLTILNPAANGNRRGASRLSVSATATHQVVALSTRANMNPGQTGFWVNESNANGSNLNAGRMATSATVVSDRVNNVTLTGQYSYRRRGDVDWRRQNDMVHTWR